MSSNRTCILCNKKTSNDLLCDTCVTDHCTHLNHKYQQYYNIKQLYTLFPNLKSKLDKILVCSSCYSSSS